MLTNRLHLFSWHKEQMFLIWQHASNSKAVGDVNSNQLLWFFAAIYVTNLYCNMLLYVLIIVWRREDSVIVSLSKWSMCLLAQVISHHQGALTDAVCFFSSVLCKLLSKSRCYRLLFMVVPVETWKYSFCITIKIAVLLRSIHLFEWLITADMLHNMSSASLRVASRENKRRPPT